MLNDNNQNKTARLMEWKTTIHPCIQSLRKNKNRQKKLQIGLADMEIKNGDINRDSEAEKKIGRRIRCYFVLAAHRSLPRN